LRSSGTQYVQRLVVKFQHGNKGKYGKEKGRGGKK
jgi:hypothetical protein